MQTSVKLLGSISAAAISSLLIYNVDKYFDHSPQHAATLAHVGPLLAIVGIAAGCIAWVSMQADSGDGDNDTADAPPQRYHDHGYGHDPEEDTRA